MNDAKANLKINLRAPVSPRAPLVTISAEGVSPSCEAGASAVPEAEQEDEVISARLNELVRRR